MPFFLDTVYIEQSLLKIPCNGVCFVKDYTIIYENYRIIHKKNRQAANEVIEVLFQ